MKRRLLNFSSQTFSSLQVRNFRLYFIGQAISQIGTWLYMTAIVLLALQISESGVTLGLVTACQFLPFLLLGPWAGVIADRSNKRRLLIGVALFSMSQSLLLALLVATNNATLPVLFVMSTLGGIAHAFENPTRRSFVNELVPEDHVTNAVSLNATLMTGARVIGPALAGLLATFVGLGACFLVDGLSFFAVIIGLLLMQPEAIRAAPVVRRAKGQVREGFAYMWRTPALKVPFVIMAIVGTLTFNFQVTLPLLAYQTFDGGTSAYTGLMSITSLGSVVGSLWVARRVNISTRFSAFAAFGFGLSSIALAVSPSYTAALIAAVAMGWASIAFISAANITIQLTAEPHMRGRIMALYSMVFLGSTPIGGPIIGWMAENIGVRQSIAFGGIAAVLAAGYGLVARDEATEDLGEIVQAA